MYLSTLLGSTDRINVGKYLLHVRLASRISPCHSHTSTIEQRFDMAGRLKKTTEWKGTKDGRSTLLRRD